MNNLFLQVRTDGVLLAGSAWGKAHVCTAVSMPTRILHSPRPIYINPLVTASDHRSPCRWYCLAQRNKQPRTHVLQTDVTNMPYSVTVHKRKLSTLFFFYLVYSSFQKSAFVSIYVQCLFYRVPEHRNVTALKPHINWEISWELPFQRTR